MSHSQQNRVGVNATGGVAPVQFRNGGVGVSIGRVPCSKVEIPVYFPPSTPPWSWTYHHPPFDSAKYRCEDHPSFAIVNDRCVMATTLPQGSAL
eukprot:764585-Hanusia_phi.AAC.7